ncbi:MAG TPA: thioredoxin [Kineobactrum sp.]
MNDYIVDIDETNAARLLIDESHQRPVLVDFWADWCEPCKMLMPLLEKLANEYSGAFLLARVNADEQPSITQQFGVRSLPTLMIVQGGQPVDGLVGAQSEAQLRELLEKYLPKPWDALLDQGVALMAEDNFRDALIPLRQAFEDSGQRHDITLAYAHALIESNRFDDAENVLGTVLMTNQDAHWEQLVAQLKLKREAAMSPEIAALEERLEAEPDNHEVRTQLAIQYTDAGYYREALEHLLTVLRQDINHADGATKRTFLNTIASLGKGDPLAAEYQRQLYSLLY